MKIATKKMPPKIISLMLASLLLASLMLALPTNQASAADNCQTFPETGFVTCGLFFQYWKVNGGLTQQGYPISGVFYERNALPPAGDGQLHVVQYSQRARFEYHPANQPPYNVLLGLLGTEQYTAKYKTAPDPDATYYNSRDDCETFPQTGFKICGRFLEYWRSNGGLAQQGYPISAVFMEQNAPAPAGDGKVHRVQYFQRARFEQHAENQRPYDVLLGLLGTEQYQAKYAVTQPEFLNPQVPSATPGPGQGIIQAAYCLTAIEGGGTGGGNTIQACVPNGKPPKDSTVTLYARQIINGQPIAGAQLSSIWHFGSASPGCTGVTGNDGIASCSLDLTGKATSGRAVKIDVTLTYNGQTNEVTVSFIPQ